MIASAVFFILAALVAESAASHMYGYDGGYLSLECPGDGQTEWLKDGVKLTADGRIRIQQCQEGDTWTSKLLIETVREDDAGTYVCNSGGRTVDTFYYEVFGRYEIYASSADKCGFSIVFLMTSIYASVSVLL